MNKKLCRLLDEIQKTEEKIEEYEEHLKELNIRRKQMEDAEIIKSIRSMKLNSREMLSLLESLKNGTAAFPDKQEATDGTVGKGRREGCDIQEKRILESEETGNENRN